MRPESALSSLLERNGYRTSFIYGGEAHFDNMRQFFMGNGFQTVLDENDYEDPLLVAPWGVSDEDLFNRAHEEFSEAGEQPFFSLVFTSSNHSPFEIPENRVAVSPHGPRTTGTTRSSWSSPTTALASTAARSCRSTASGSRA